MSESFKIESKKDWVTGGIDKPNTEQLTLGCLQRIADATELMAKQYQSLINDRDYYKKMYDEIFERNKKLERGISALKGHIKRIKKAK